MNGFGCTRKPVRSRCRSGIIFYKGRWLEIEKWRQREYPGLLQIYCCLKGVNLELNCGVKKVVIGGT